MCIIIAKDKYGRLPSEEELKNSFEYNNDGAGFMYVENGKVVIDKGYMSWDSFIKHYKMLLGKHNNFNKKCLVIHCRIGTSGMNIKENTHPYPISNKEKMLRASHLSQEEIGIAHNGVIGGYGTATGLNDTQEFIIKYIYPLYTHFKDFYKNKDMMYGIEKITNSKFAILTKEDKLYFIGGFIEEKGLYFSNTTYKTYYRTNTLTYGNYYGYYGEDYKWDWYKDTKEKQDTKNLEDKEDYMIQLEKNWFIDFYGNGDVTKVGNKEYWFDYDTLELFEWKNNEFQLIAVNPIIYDERYEEIW